MKSIQQVQQMLHIELKHYIGRFFGKKNPHGYVFLAINGAGLGHLTRALGIAKQLATIDPKAEITFFTTSIGVSLVNREGFRCFHIPPADLVKDRISVRQWNKLFEENLSAVIKLYRPSYLVFDGTTPYLGLRRVMVKYKYLISVWVKRGLYKDDGLNEKLQGYAAVFDRVIVPGELGDNKVVDNGHVAMTPPIVMCDKSEIFSRAEALKRLNLSATRKNIYVQLGAGNINDITDIQQRIVNLLKSTPGIDVVIAHSPIALKTQYVENAINYEGYPGSVLLAAFDLVISAAGYNSVCELVYHGVPAIFVPNALTKSDDQIARAVKAEAYGCAWVSEAFDDDDLLRLVAYYLSGPPSVDARLTIENGARAAAQLLLDIKSPKRKMLPGAVQIK